MTRYGYVRVSSKDQNEARQMVALRKEGIDEADIFIDKKSGKDFERPAYRKLLRKLRPGDLLVIKSIDRLGRNYDEIIRQWQFLTRDKEADILVLDMPLLDTRQGKDLLGTFISDLVLQILSFVAENEREVIHQRQAEGIAAAKAKGVRFGRPERPLPDNFAEVYKDWKEGHITGSRAAATCQMPLTTFRRKVSKMEVNHGGDDNESDQR